MGLKGTSLSALVRKFLSLEESKPLVALVVLYLASAVISPYFLTVYNQKILLLQASPLVMLALGESMIIMMGSIDLSPGSTMALAGLIAALASNVYGFPVILSALIGVGVGALIGLVNGLAVTKAKIPSFVATLASMVAARGLVLLVTGGTSIYGLVGYEWLTDETAGLANMVWLFIAFTALTYFILKKTTLGLKVYAIGGNEEAVRYSGLNADNVKIAVFTIAGSLYAIAGLMMNARLQAAYPWTGYGSELDAIAASVLGGIQLTGGVGSPVGSFIGAYILTLISNILILLGVNPYLQWVVKGFILGVAALTLTRGLRYVK
ncbi:ABC transporter permease [Thermogladius sp. KZ2Tp1]|uniref:ABC transporter permease n=1 Tax=Thermogladius sp. KZ2Tp1 TaxID=3136289 RepID=UPI003DAA3B5C